MNGAPYGHGFRVKKFAAALAKIGFDVTTPSIEGAFVRIYALKNCQEVRREAGATARPSSAAT